MPEPLQPAVQPGVIILLSGASSSGKTSPGEWNTCTGNAQVQVFTG